MGLAIGIICALLLVYFLGSMSVGTEYIDHQNHCNKVNDEYRRIQ